VGRKVHYVSAGSADGKYPSVCRSADITEVDETGPVPESGVPYVGLAVLNPTGLHFRPLAESGGVRYDEGRAPYTWHWPERV